MRKAIMDHFSENEIKEVIKELKARIKTSDELLKFVVEQLFGKAPQRLELTGKDGQNIVVEISREIAEKNGLDL